METPSKNVKERPIKNSPKAHITAAHKTLSSIDEFYKVE